MKTHRQFTYARWLGCLAVTEGKVRIDDAEKGEALLQGRTDTAPPLLVAGERAEIRSETGAPAVVVAVTAPEIERALAWQERRIAFAATPLTEVVAEFNRYNRHKLVIGDARLADRRFGGTFRADGYEALVRLLEMNFGVTADRRRDETVLLSPAPALTPDSAIAVARLGRGGTIRCRRRPTSLLFPSRATLTATP